MASRPLLSVMILLPVLMIDAILEMTFLSTMVAFLNGRASYPFSVSFPEGQTFLLKGHPLTIHANQGHTSNAAGGMALIVVGFGGWLAIWLQSRRTQKTGSSRLSLFFTFWVVMAIVSVLLTLSALIYTFIVTYQTDNQRISLEVAAANAAPEKYPDNEWTPETWFLAIVNQVPLTFEGDRADMQAKIRIMRGWRWNLIPLFILGLTTACAAVYEWLMLRRQGGRDTRTSKERAGDSL